MSHHSEVYLTSTKRQPATAEADPTPAERLGRRLQREKTTLYYLEARGPTDTPLTPLLPAALSSLSRTGRGRALSRTAASDRHPPAADPDGRSPGGGERPREEAQQGGPPAGRAGPNRAEPGRATRTLPRRVPDALPVRRSPVAPNWLPPPPSRRPPHPQPARQLGLTSNSRRPRPLPLPRAAGAASASAWRKASRPERGGRARSLYGSARHGAAWRRGGRGARAEA